MQLCCNYQWIEYMENKQTNNQNQMKECIYFDSGYNCSAKRLKQMISTLVSSSFNSDHSEHSENDENDQNEQEIKQTKTIKQLLKNITISYPNDLLSLLANIISLERESKSIKLIVIDSIVSFYKKTSYDNAIKLQTIQTLMQHLSVLSQQKNCAIVIVNHLTTKEINRNYTSLNYELSKEFPFYFTKSLGVSFSCFIKLTLYLFQLPTETQIIVHSADSFINHHITYSISDNGFM